MTGKKITLILLISFFAVTSSAAQDDVAKKLEQLNQDIDTWVVQHNMEELKKAYAEDFSFQHGSGRLEGKESWLKSVERNTYLLRQHDSVKVELHDDVALLIGNMSIQRKDKQQIAQYFLKYIRVYRFRNKNWELISHHTTQEKHER